jgi:hypothetical protein
MLWSLPVHSFRSLHTVRTKVYPLGFGIYRASGRTAEARSFVRGTVRAKAVGGGHAEAGVRVVSAMCCGGGERVEI